MALHHYFQCVQPLLFGSKCHKKRLSHSCVVVVGLDSFIPSSPRCRNIQTPTGCIYTRYIYASPTESGSFPMKRVSASFFFPPQHQTNGDRLSARRALFTAGEFHPGKATLGGGQVGDKSRSDHFSPAPWQPGRLCRA